MYNYDGYYLDNYLDDDRKILYFNPKSDDFKELFENKKLKKEIIKGDKIYVNMVSKSVCPFHLECRGCSYVNLDYDSQFEIKKEQFDYIFRNEECSVQYFGDNRYNYKEKVRVHVSLIDGQIVFNLNGENPKMFFPCHIINSKINDFILNFNKFDYKIEYNDLFSFNEIFISYYDSKIVVNLKKDYNIYDKLLMKKLDLMDYSGLVVDFENKYMLSYKLKTDREYELFYLSKSFLQSNLNVNQKMVNFLYGKLKSIIKDNKYSLYDFFGGNGNFSVCLASLFNEVYLVESDNSASRTLLEANRVNNVDVNFLKLNLENEYPHLLEGKKIAILDPPRVGVYDRQLRRILNDFDYVIYISCNPKVIKRQLKIIKRYHDIIDLGMFDNFAYTKYFESIVISKRKTN